MGYVNTQQTLIINKARKHQKQHQMLQYVKNSNLLEKYNSFQEYMKPLSHQ